MAVVRKSPVKRKVKGSKKKKTAPAKRTPSTVATKLKAKRIRTKKIKLSNLEKQMLQYPPTPITWVCAECNNINPGKNKICWACRVEPKSKTLLWPQYLEACEKVLIQPGDLWKPTDTYIKTGLIRKKGTYKWEPHPFPEGYSLP